MARKSRGPRLLSLVLRNFFGKPATVQYPYQRTSVESDFRGRHYADLNKCTGCSLCKLECPADAIEMVSIPSEYAAPKINPRRVYPVVNYFRCVYCYRCVTACPVNAYVTTNDYRLVSKEPIDSSQFSLSTLARGA